MFQQRTKHEIRSCQRAIERSTLGIKLSDKIKGEDIRKRAQLIDAERHITRSTYKRWTKRIAKWKGPSGRRSKGRPKDRWVDEIKNSQRRQDDKGG